jgi:hypothetical protein
MTVIISGALSDTFAYLKKQKEKFSGNQRTIRHVSGARHGWDINELPAKSKN